MRFPRFVRPVVKTIDFIVEVLKWKNIRRDLEASFLGEGGSEDIKISGRVFAGNDKAKVTVSRTAEVVDEGGMNAGVEESLLELRHLVWAFRMYGDDRAWSVVDWEAGFAERGFDMSGVEVESATELRIRRDQFQRGESSGRERKGQRCVADEEPAALDNLPPECSRAQDRATVGSKGLAQRDGLDES